MIRMVATVLGVLAGGIGVAGLLSRYLPISNESILIVAVGSPYLIVAALFAMVAFVVARRWVPTILAALLCIAMIGVILPRYFGPEKSAAPSVAVRVLTVNLDHGRGDPRKVVALALASADVLVLEEMTPSAVAGVTAAGLEAVFPYRFIDTRQGSAGIGIWSRHPLADAAPVTGFAKPMLHAKILLPNTVVAPTLLAVHLAAPWVHPLHFFRDDIARFEGTLGDVARTAGAGAVIVAGDLNSTFDMQPFRRLLDQGYRDAAEQAGAGMTRTYPDWLPLIGIDHVLVRNSLATSAYTVPVPGSDHRGLVANVDVPVNPTVS